MSPALWAKWYRLYALLDTIVEPDDRNLPTPNSRGVTRPLPEQPAVLTLPRIRERLPLPAFWSGPESAFRPLSSARRHQSTPPISKTSPSAQRPIGGMRFVDSKERRREH